MRITRIILAAGLATLLAAPSAAAAENHAPIAVNDSYAVAQGHLLTVPAPGVLANDTDPDGDGIAVTSFAGGAHADSFSVNGDGSISYDPIVGYVGTETLTYTLEDSHGATATGTVTITVNESRAPIPVDDHYTIGTGTELHVSAPGFLSNDSDPDDDDIFAGVVTNFSHGTHDSDALGNLNYVPEAGFLGTDTMTYRLGDSNEYFSDEATITVTVVENDPPVAVDDHYTVVAGQSLNVPAPGYLAKDTDPDGNALHGTSTGSFSHAATSGFLTTGGFYYTPESGFTGDDTVTYYTEDEYGAQSAAGTITVTVTAPPNTAPLAVDDHYTVVEGQTLTIPVPGLLANDTDAEGDSLAAVDAGGFSHASLVVGGSGGSLTYTPEDGFTGTDTGTYKAKDSHNAVSNIATITIVVTPVEAPINLVDDEYATTEGETLTIDAPGVLANDVLPSGSTLAPCTGATHGTATCHSDGSLTFTPDAGFVGDATFTYTVDGPDADASRQTAALVPDQALVTIHVAAKPDDPVDPPASDGDEALPDTGSEVTPTLPLVGGLLTLAGFLVLRRTRRIAT
ncbi:hypothetical protein GCM10022234_07320 [Aeromicrobium panaciterrae]|uniref:Ig-like domain-containing protein n=1 Tax=Aeromicrobium panaciterrae TaxID=363861 RepID=UPI0031D72AEF